MQQELLNDAEKFGIQVPLTMINASEALIEKVCNGVGAEWMPDNIRAILNKRFNDFKIPTMIHDWHYTFSEATRDVIDEVYYKNCLKIADSFAWWRFIRRSQIKTDALKLYIALKVGGGKAFSEAQEQGKELLKNVNV